MKKKKLAPTRIHQREKRDEPGKALRHLNERSFECNEKTKGRPPPIRGKKAERSEKRTKNGILKTFRHVRRVQGRIYCRDRGKRNCSRYCARGGGRERSTRGKGGKQLAREEKRRNSSATQDQQMLKDTWTHEGSIKKKEGTSGEAAQKKIARTTPKKKTAARRTILSFSREAKDTHNGKGEKGFGRENRKQGRKERTGQNRRERAQSIGYARAKTKQQLLIRKEGEKKKNYSSLCGKAAKRRKRKNSCQESRKTKKKRTSCPGGRSSARALSS